MSHPEMWIIMPLKIGTLNLCLGFPGKKDIVEQIIIDRNIDVLCLQETEVGVNLNPNVLSLGGCKFENELNTKCARVGVYIR
jgi:hypothetical protein